MFDKEPYYTEKIEAYLRNELTNGEKADFERLLRQDPLLYNEFALQQDIIGSIQAYRKNQLKQRLENISVDDIASGGQGVAKIASLFLGGVALLGIVGWLVFNEPDTTGKIEDRASAVVSQKTVPVPPVSADEKQPQNDQASFPTMPAEASAPKTEPSIEATTQDPTRAGNLKPKVKVDKTSITMANAQADNRPQIEETPRKLEADNKVERSVTIDEKNLTPQRLHITDNTNSKLKFHYYYINNQITLLGFDQPYILLEIQPENSTYLYYEGQFYRLDTSQHRPSPIKEIMVTDPELVKKLNDRLTERH